MANPSTSKYAVKIVGLKNECCGPFVKKYDILRLVDTKIMVDGKEQRAAKAVRVSSEEDGCVVGYASIITLCNPDIHRRLMRGESPLVRVEEIFMEKGKAYNRAKDHEKGFSAHCNFVDPDITVEE
jgi:hypothetical protein